MAEKENGKTVEFVKSTSLFHKTVEEIMHESMIPYAEHVILDRALPRVEDGLKPVQRRILYTMLELGIFPDKPHRKSARIVGDCLGKFHPHGDSSVYDAMVRMAQDFNMRMPLVNGNGNFGSIDGDRAAAMRYTEARMAPLAMELLRDIDKDTVKFSLNFDDTIKEPDTLPGRFPNLLVNGAYGIAVGLATNIPTHNLGEVIDGTIALIDNPDITLKELMRFIKGPDFPTGGYLIMNDLVQAYETGKGKIILRAKVFIEAAENDKKNIVITELPFQVNKATLLEKILALKEDKKDELAGIYDICDESDRNGMRAVIRVKKDADVDQILKLLFKHTDLETSYGINMVAIADGKPQQMGLIDILYYYINYQREVVLKRTRYELAQAKEREHILQGLVIAVNNIDEVIRIIKSSNSVSDARNNLRAAFDLSERQANAILDMRLARLTHLEIDKLEQELAEVQELIRKLQAIVDSRKKQLQVVKDELYEIKRKYKDNRRTKIVAKAEDIDIVNETVEPEAATYAVVVSVNGQVKKVPEKNYKMSNRSLSERATEAETVSSCVLTSSNNKVLAFTNLGNGFKLDFKDLPEGKWREKGQLLSGIYKTAEANERIVALFPLTESVMHGNLLFFTKAGYVKRTAWTEYDIVKYYFQAIKLKDGDELISVEAEQENASLVFLSSSGMILHAEFGDLPLQGRVAGGVHGINVGNDEITVFGGQAVKGTQVLALTDKGYFKRVDVNKIDKIARYRKGVKLMDLSGDNGKSLVFATAYQKDASVLFIAENGEAYGMQATDISLEQRGGKGKPIKELRKGIATKKAYRHITEAQIVAE